MTTRSEIPEATVDLQRTNCRGILRLALPFILIGTAMLVAGGLFSAVTAYSASKQTAWATAFAVLVGGVAQIAIGLALAWFGRPGGRALRLITLVGWNLGTFAVLAGQFTATVALTYVGSAALAVALVAAALTTHLPPGSSRPQTFALWGFRAFVVFLAASVVVGSILAHLGR